MIKQKEMLILCALVLGMLLISGCCGKPTIQDNGELQQDIEDGKSVMWIGPHPDDEVSAAGTLALACGHEGNKCWVFAFLTTEQIREGLEPALREEANDWLEENYLEEYIYYPGEARDKPPEEIKATVKSVIEEKRPDIILTFSPYGYYNHPDHQAVSNLLTNIRSELSYRPEIYHIINMDNALSQKHQEYTKYPPTDEINLDFYSETLGKTVFEAKIEIAEAYAPSVPLIKASLENPEFYKDKKEYFRKAR